MTRNCVREDVVSQVVTPSLLPAGIVFARRLHYRECHPGRVRAPVRQVHIATGQWWHGRRVTSRGDTVTGSAQRDGCRKKREPRTSATPPRPGPTGQGERGADSHAARTDRPDA